MPVTDQHLTIAADEAREFLLDSACLECHNRAFAARPLLIQVARQSRF